MSKPQAGRTFSASAVRGGGQVPTVGLVSTVEGRSGAEWSAHLTIEQAEQLIDTVQGALDLIEQEAAQTAAATKQ